VVKQYPHTIRIETVTGSSQDANGNWTAGTPATPVEIPCRYEPRTSAGTVKTAANETVLFSCIVYMPLPVPDIQVNTSVTVLNGSSEMFRGSVIQFKAGQLNARLWL
jgi:hypothetical protein